MQNAEKHEVTSLCLFDLLLKLPPSSASSPLTLLGKLVYEDQDNLQDIALKHKHNNIKLYVIAAVQYC
jgi:hypothetical protein